MSFYHVKNLVCSIAAVSVFSSLIFAAELPTKANFISLQPSYRLLSVEDRSECQIDISYLSPLSPQPTSEIKSFVGKMFADKDLVKRNFSEGYLKSLYQRVGENHEQIPEVFLGDALQRQMHYVFLKEFQSDYCFGYFSFRPCGEDEYSMGHLLYSIQDDLKADGLSLWNIGAFFLPEYREKGIFSKLIPEFFQSLNSLASGKARLLVTTDTDHPLIHLYIEKHPEFGFKCIGEDNKKTMYVQSK